MHVKDFTELGIEKIQEIFYIKIQEHLMKE